MMSVAQILEGLPLRLPVVNFNGAYLSDFATGRHEVVNAIDPEATERIIGEILPSHGCLPFLSTFDGSEDRAYYQQVINGGMETYLSGRIAKKDTRWRQADDLRDRLDEQAICITLIDRGERLGPVEQELRSTFGDLVQLHHIEDMYNPGWHWLTVHSGLATKSRGIETLRERYGFGDHRLVVFGDQINDIPMFRIADHAVAVANAIDPLKELADEIIGPADHGSVVEYLGRRFL